MRSTTGWSSPDSRRLDTLTSGLTRCGSAAQCSPTRGAEVVSASLFCFYKKSRPFGRDQWFYLL